MGTRADFYLGRGADAEWIGSIAWDGYPGQRTLGVIAAKRKNQFRAAVRNLMQDKDATVPEMGWPWPWENSHTTDYAYAWDKGSWISCFGSLWTPAKEIGPSMLTPARISSGWHAAKCRYHGVDAGDITDLPRLPADAFPDMTNRQAVTMGARSGLIVVGG